jgi:putative membrane protein
MTRSSTFFTDDEKARIEAAVHAAEARTSGEIVPMVVDESYGYPRAEIVGGGSFAMGVALLLSWWFCASSEWFFLPLFLALYLPCKWLIRFTPPLKRLLISNGEISAEVEERALVAFITHGLHRTREENGILILISLMERRVHVLADRGINAKVPTGTWDEIVATITKGLAEGNAADALCTAITRCGDLLAPQFPHRDDDRDELPNLILR